MHEQPVLRKMRFFTSEQYEITERIARQGLYLPSGLTITIEQIDMVCDAVQALLGQ